MMLRLEGITKFYGQFCALNGLSMEVEDGALYGFVGPNGAGKSTAMRIMCGILAPTSGKVSIDGKELRSGDQKQGRLIGYVPDSFGIYNDLKVYEYMDFFASCYGMTGLTARKRIEELLEFVGLSERSDFFVEALSRGMKQKLSLARALIHDPSILILDEPNSGLDPRSRYEFKSILSRLSDEGKTMVISSHMLNDISELCTDIGIIDHGSMVMSGRLSEVMKIVTSENPIVIGVETGLSRAIRSLKEREMVRSMSIKGNDILINFGGDRRAEAELLRELIEEGIGIRSFSRHKGSLESIFMQLTGHGEEKLVNAYENGRDEDQL